MTVAELIKLLKDADKDAKVCLDIEDSDGFWGIEGTFEEDGKFVIQADPYQ